VVLVSAQPTPKAQADAPFLQTAIEALARASTSSEVLSLNLLITPTLTESLYFWISNVYIRTNTPSKPAI
jgi:hypothetical protein